MFHKIMVAYDESSEARRALRASIELAKTLSAELSVVTVLEPLPGYYSFAVSAVPAWNWTEEKRVRYSALQAEAHQQAKAAGVVLDAELISGDEVGSIVECAKRHHSDLLVLGLRKHSCLVPSECRHGPRSFFLSTSPQKQMKAILTTSPTGSCLSTVARGRMQASTSKARRSDAVQVVRRTRSERKRAFRVLIETHNSFGNQSVLASE